MTSEVPGLPARDTRVTCDVRCFTMFAHTPILNSPPYFQDAIPALRKDQSVLFVTRVTRERA